MKKVTLTKLQKYFSVNKKEAAAFILMLLHLNEKDEFSSTIGRIKKLEGNLFEVLVDEQTVKGLVDLFIEETQEPMEDFFK